MKNFLLLIVLITSSSAQAALSQKVIGDLVFWDQARGFQLIQANPDVFSEISPFWYTINSTGAVVPYMGGTASYEDTTIVNYLHSKGILVTPTVTNLINGVWDGAVVSKIILSPTLSDTNIRALVDLTVRKGYDGIDLDYENLAATDRSAFSDFVARLATALHQQGKILAVDVYGKTSEPGDWSGPQAQDWQSLGRSADEIRLMTYEYHWATSAPGAVAPTPWVNDVLAFAKRVIPGTKVIHGIPLYGYDWKGSQGVDHVWLEIIGIAAANGATIQWDATAQTPWFKFTSSTGELHSVWFENQASVDAKLSLTLNHDVGGVFLWRLGGEDPGVMQTLRSRFASSPTPTPSPTLTSTPPPAPTDTLAPLVTITSPTAGIKISTKKVLLAATASDNVGVTKVAFYVDGTLFFSDTIAPYSVYWNATKAKTGTHVIKAVAYDAAGNSTATQISIVK